jgi:murein DD-endopeptidase MepM/ murein hydrolase activator NlpD
VAAGALGLSPALADTKQQLDEAKAELARVQAELQSATANLSQAMSRLEQTRAEIAETRLRIGAIEHRLDRIHERLAERAVVAFTNGPASTIDLLLSSQSFSDFSDRLEFLGSVSQGDVDLALEEQNTQVDLQRERDDLLGLSQRQADTVAQLSAVQQRIDADFAQIQGRVSELTARYREELAASRELQVLGQTPDPNAAIQVCPVAGPSAFVDSFGWPRPGGRTHQGIDLISPFGTPVVAAHPGVVSHSSSTLGGIQAYVRAPSGTYTFYAHLSSYSSASGSVEAGTVIGYVGSTGDAGTVNHLHFEYHPGGGAAIDPYQLLLAVC